MFHLHQHIITSHVIHVKPARHPEYHVLSTLRLVTAHLVYNVCGEKKRRGEMEYIVLTFVVGPEGEFQVSYCSELGTASFGRTKEEALENLADATEVYLNTLENLGECRLVLKEKGVRIYSYEPAELEVRRAKFPVGSIIRPTVMPLHAECA
jgi:predicted RNase H-like HicB family nuclease